jgi:predicted ABC-class ATPase
MQSTEDFHQILNRIDGQRFGAYLGIRSSFALRGCSLFVDHVQSDPFAAPSKMRVRVAQADAALPESLFDNPVRRLALEDFLARRVRRAIQTIGSRSGGRSKARQQNRRGGRNASDSRGSGKSGLISIDAGGQEVLQRTALVVTSDWVEARLEIGLPAAGRRILGRVAQRLLVEDLPHIIAEALVGPPLDEAFRFVEYIENQEYIRSHLSDAGLIAFIGDGAHLPRQSGVSDQPLSAEAAVPFEAPESLRVEVDLLHPTEIDGESRTSIVGLGIRKGVTLIVGGGYHGKSTLLRAIERGVYPHIPGDGREWVISDLGLVKIRAEDGRRVEQVDIDAFISGLPLERSTTSFHSDDASGSTSQAANIVEAIEARAIGLLLDEDTSATNFMVRDARMQALIHKDQEPITPFVERVRELFETLSVSTVLVMGGCGDYFETADTVIALDAFRPVDVTAEARSIAAESTSPRRAEARSPLREVEPRIPKASSFDPSRGRKEVAISARALDRIGFGREDIDLRAIEQLVDISQTRAIASAIHLGAQRYMDGTRTLSEVLDELETLFDTRGLDELDPFHRPGHHPGNYARPRRFEIAAAINRLRTVRMKQLVDDPAQRIPRS